MTGKTSSKKLQRIGHTHPLVDNVIQTCINFRRMIHGEEGGPDVKEWIRQAQLCRVREITEFAEYIRKDRAAVELAIDNDEDSDDWWTLQGIKLMHKPTQPGVYIHRGQRVSIGIAH